MADLHLNLKKEYFEAIKSGEKLFEFRLVTPRWRKIIEGKDFDRVFFKCGYPPAADGTRILARSWEGFEMQTITHPHFGPESVEVFAIRVGAVL